jgi:DNA-binding transcriptional ArsR family regulator
MTDRSPSELTSAFNEIDLEALTKLFRALSDPVRLKLLLLIAERERNVTSLCAATGLAQPTVSHHLGLLRMSALADSRREGKSIFYSPGTRMQIDDNESISFQTEQPTTATVRVTAAPSTLSD